MDDMRTLRVATWNLLNRSRDYLDRLTDESLALDAMGVDVALLQEVRTDSVDATRELLRAAGYRSEFGRAVGSSVACVAWRLVSVTLSGSPRPVHSIEAVDVPLAAVDSTGAEVRFTATSWHGHWGALAQHERLEEARTLARRADAEANGHGGTELQLLGGDLNAEPDEDAVRFLMGCGSDGDGGYTRYVEAQDTARRLHGTVPFATSLADGQCATETAAPHGIDMRFLPGRRIDYLFSRGWKYGKVLGFTGRVLSRHEMETVSAPFVGKGGLAGVSDHLPVVADVILG